MDVRCGWSPKYRKGLRAALFAFLVINVWQMSPPLSRASEQARAGNDLAYLVRYAAAVQTLSTRELKEEYEQMRHAADPSTRTIRMALLLGHTDTSFRDVARAQGLLDAYLARPISEITCCQEFALFLRNTLSREQRRHPSGVRDALREERNALAMEVQNLRLAVAEERTKRIKLEAQIEALKVIERDLKKTEGVKPDSDEE